MRPVVVVSVVIDLPPQHEYHRASLAAIRHAAEDIGEPVDVRVARTDQITSVNEFVHGTAAILIGPGSPYLSPDAAITCIRRAREAGVPLVGTLGGFQHVLVEHARNLAGIPDASHAEYGDAGRRVITLLACSLLDQTIKIDITPGTVLHSVYRREQASERTTCSYGLARDVEHIANQYGMIVSGTDETGEVRAIERIDHPYFVGTLFQPQLTSAEGSPHPVFVGLLKAARSAS